MRRSFLIFILTFFAVSNSVFALTEEQEKEIRKEAENFNYQTVTTSEGLNFRVPEDMPIEKRNGIVAPIPFDEYMYGKFKQIDERLKSMEAKLDSIKQLIASIKESNPKPLKSQPSG